jgi:predicted SprT family Zn-dependent metalloprotease
VVEVASIEHEIYYYWYWYYKRQLQHHSIMYLHLVLAVTGLLTATSFAPYSSLLKPLQRRHLLHSQEDEYITVEVVTTSTSTGSSREAKNVESKNMKYKDTTFVGYSLYEEVKEKQMQRALVENPIWKVFGILFNPTTLLFALYFSGIAWNKVLWLQNILRIFGKGELTKTKDVEPVKELPFQTFECEGCRMEMKPARGRAEAIFGRPRFRCSKCGAKASAYFDVDDLNDPRAVSRLERLEKEKNNDVYGDDDDDEVTHTP